MAYNYPPLDYVRGLADCAVEMYGEQPDHLKILNTTIGGIPEDVTLDDVIRFTLSNDFMMKDIADKKFETYNDNVFEAMPTILQGMGIKVSDIRSGRVDPRSEMRDVLISTPLMEKWAQYKQIYKPDADFAQALMSTDKAKLSRDAIKHLPLNDFYVDIEDLHYGQVHGIFVRIDLIDDVAYLTMFALTYNQVFFSSYLSFGFDSEGNITVDYRDLNKNDTIVIPALKDLNVASFEFKPLVILVLQLLIYMGVAEKDVVESPKTKSTYRPRKTGSPVKNKFSELQMFDVGLRYGTEFRRKIKELNVDKSKLTVMSEDEERHHKSPRPHLRQAHWAHRWCGPKPDQHLELRWIEPTFVGFGDNAIASTATIHKIRKEK